MRNTFIWLLATVCLVTFVGTGLAHADTAPTSAPTVLAGSASGGSDSATVPADQLPDVAANPAAAISAEKAAYNKEGWPLALLAGLIMLGRGVGFFAKKWAPLAWLGKGRAAVITAGVVTLAAAAFNALALGGTWYAALVAAAAAGFALMKPHAEPQPAQS
jgi:hypothetical protein